MALNRLSSNFQVTGQIQTENLVGKLLVASPQSDLTSPLGQAVVLVLQDNDEGVFGVVVNQEASPEMQLEWQKMAGSSFAADKLVAGGPIAGPVLALHCRPDLGEMEVPGGLFVSAQKEVINQLNEIDQHREVGEEASFRIIMGAVNWTRQRFESEIDSGSWFVVDGSADQVFSSSEGMWESLVRSFGRLSIAEVTGISQFPQSPLLN